MSWDNRDRPFLLRDTQGDKSKIWYLVPLPRDRRTQGVKTPPAAGFEYRPIQFHDCGPCFVAFLDDSLVSPSLRLEAMPGYIATDILEPLIRSFLSLRNDTGIKSCIRCGHVWAPRTGPIKQCPKCKSTLWNTARIRKGVTPAKRNTPNPAPITPDPLAFDYYGEYDEDDPE